jgi:hypothetical protein
MNEVLECVSGSRIDDKVAYRVPNITWNTIHRGRVNSSCLGYTAVS